MLPVGVEPTVRVRERQQTNTFDRAGTGTVDNGILQDKIHIRTAAHCNMFCLLKFCPVTFHESRVLFIVCTLYHIPVSVASP